MDSRRKVVFVIPTLSGGGAERVLIRILRNMDRARFDPHLVLFRKVGAFLDHVPSDVAIHSLVHCKYYFIFRWLIYFRYKKYVSMLRPDVVLSFMWYPNFIVLLEKWLGRGERKVIVSERYTLALSYEGRMTEWIRKWIIRLFYPTADRVLAVTQQMRQELLERAPLLPARVKVINNTVDIQGVNKLSKEPVNLTGFDPLLPIIISTGRLSIQKGFNYLIRAFSQVVERHPTYLVILGEGKERNHLERLISQVGIQERVHLPGFVMNPYKYLTRSSIFVLSSLYEGFPNVLVEAMALGIPCIATRCPTGPEEIITDGVNGLLVPPGDEKSLADAIKRLLVDEGFRKRLGEAGKKRAEDFRAEKIVRQYEDAIESVCVESVEN
ncbi:MAG: glycosyltransferase [Thermodesulfobacteriota bacterium]|nr:glycosyltransferase [Thermodesulfobacteriota bacterium]